MAKAKWTTAAESTRRREADPDSVAERDARAARRADRAERIAADEAILVVELAAVGAVVSSVYDFVGDQPPSDAALPVLVRHLSVDHCPVIREGLIRALGIPGARKIAFDPLCDEFRKERDPNLRWVVANALSGMARFEELADLLPGIEEFGSLFPSRGRSESNA